MNDAQKDLNSLKRRRYVCEPDSMAAAKRLISDHLLSRLKDLKVLHCFRECRKEESRPKKMKREFIKVPLINLKKASTRTDREMDIPAFYERNLNSGNNGPTCDQTAHKLSETQEWS